MIVKAKLGNDNMSLKATLTARSVVVGDYTVALTPTETGGILTVTRGNDVQTLDLSNAGGSGLPEGASPNQQLVTDASGAATWADIPTALPNPQKLFFMDEQLGNILGVYSGSQPITIDVPNSEEVKKAAVLEAQYSVSWNNLLDKPFGSQGVEGVVYSAAGLTMDEDGMYLITDPSLVLHAGFEYEVSWNGESYTCHAWEFEAEGMIAVCIGNKYITGGDDTGEPFMLMSLPPAAAAMTGISAQLNAFDGSATVDITITGTELIKKIDEKYIPNEIPRAERYEVVRTVTLDAEASEIDITGLNLSKADAFLEVPAASGNTGISGDAYSDEGLLGEVYFMNAVHADGARYTFMHAESANGRAFVEGADPVSAKSLAGTMRRSSYGKDGNKPIKRIRFYGASSAKFPAGTTVVIKGVLIDGSSGIGGGSVATGSIGLVDNVTGETYQLSVIDGQLTMQTAAADAVAVSEDVMLTETASEQAASNAVTLTDTTTGRTYTLYVSNGKLTMSEVTA